MLVPRDSNGFEDLDAFWNLSGSHRIPILSRNLLNSFTLAAKVKLTRKSTSSNSAATSDEFNFNYENESTISG